MMSKKTRPSSLRSTRKEQLIAREDISSTKTRDYVGTSNDVVRIEVLEKKIKVDSKNHENEKEKITYEKDREIKGLEAENESLKIEVANKNDKIKQLDIANGKKEFLLKKRDHDVKELMKGKEDLRKRADELQSEISSLSEEYKQLTEKYQKTLTTDQRQQEEIKSLKKVINDLKEELDFVRAERIEKEKKMTEQLKAMDARMDEFQSDAKARNIEMVKKMEEIINGQEEGKRREKLLQEEVEQREALQAENNKRANNQMHEHIDKVFKEILRCKNEIKKEIKENAGPPNERNEGFVINGSKNVNLQNGDHYYIHQPPRRQINNSPRGNIQPQVQLSLPPSIGGVQNRRGIYSSYKMPTYRK